MFIHHLQGYSVTDPRYRASSWPASRPHSNVNSVCSGIWSNVEVLLDASAQAHPGPPSRSDVSSRGLSTSGSIASTAEGVNEHDNIKVRQLPHR